jgi:hypothetical protein
LPFAGKELKFIKKFIAPCQGIFHRGEDSKQENWLGTMSKMSKRTLIASTVIGAFVLGSSAVSADALNDLHSEEAKIHVAAAKSQEKINLLYEQSQELLAEYRNVVDENENLKVYNDYVATLVADQQRGIDSLQRQIDQIDETKRGIVPLLFRMIDSLEKFIGADVPIKLVERKARIERLRDVMGNSNVTVSERFRQVIEAYQIELDYGSKISAYQESINVKGTDITVDLFNLGRTALIAISLDQKNAWRWDNAERLWVALGSEYLESSVAAVRMARKQLPVNLVKLPIPAAE